MAKPDHEKRARQAWPVLVQGVQAGRAPFTYGEISSAIGVHHRAAQYFLGVIQRYCDRAQLPPLQAMAVNKETKLPGLGYHGSARTPSEHADALVRVRSHQWPTKAPF